MSFYETRIKGKDAEEILAITGGLGQIDVWKGDEGELLRVAAQIRVTQRQIEAQFNATKHMVDCANALVASEDRATKSLVISIDALTKSIDKASDDSGKLGKRVVMLTFALVGVGLGQIVATAWPYLAWWWHH